MKKESQGFTLMEIMIVVAIIAVLATLSISAFAGFSRRQALDASAEALANGIRDARSETLASVGRAQYGVAVLSDGFALFQGPSYAPLAPGSETFSFGAYVRASSTISELVFERLTGNSTASGTIDVYLAGDPSVKRTVSVSGTGLVGIR